MFYTVNNNNIYEFADWKFDNDCLYTNTCTSKEYSEDREKYLYNEGVVVINPNYPNIVAERERERVNNLHCTKRVLALVLKELGVSYANLQTLIATNEDAQLEWDLCVELERSNPLLDILGAQLGLAPTTIDKIFKYANGEIDKEDFDETDIVKGGMANG